MRSYRMDDMTKRAFEGPYIEEGEFDLKLIRRLREIVKAHGIRYDPQELVPLDNAMLDSIFMAGMELLLELGFYCQTTKRCIRLEEWEINKVLDSLPISWTLGEGKDAVAMNMRRVEDPTPPIIHSGPTGTLTTEGDVYVKTLRSFAQEMCIDSVGAGTLATIDGIKIKKGTPQEFRAARMLGLWAREAVTAAGRPGMHINDVAVVSPEAKICALNPQYGIRPTDGMLVSQMIELKTSMAHMALIEHMLSYGCFVGNLMTPILGGYSGGPEGTAVCTVAEHIAGAVCYNANYHYLSLTNVRNLNGTDRLGLWTISAVGEALSRNTNIMSIYDCYCASGPGEETLLREAAAGGVAASVSGMNLMGCGSCGGKLMDHETGLEARMLKEAGAAAAGMKREEANEFLRSWLPTYEERLDITKSPKGKTFQQLYDLGTAKPKKEWEDTYRKVVAELAGHGIEIR
jgi:methylamine--corrinoid protein Co-methyltransferase